MQDLSSGQSAHLKSNNPYKINWFINWSQLRMPKISINRLISKAIKKRLEGAFTTPYPCLSFLILKHFWCSEGKDLTKRCYMEHATMGCTAGSFMDINMRNVLIKKKKKQQRRLIGLFCYKHWRIKLILSQEASFHQCYLVCRNVHHHFAGRIHSTT